MKTDQRMPDHHSVPEQFTELMPREQAALDRRIAAKAGLLMQDVDWWRESMLGYSPLSDAVEQQLPRMMANLDDACKLETRPEVGHYAVQGILAALHQIQKQARARAMEEAREWAEENDE